MLRGEVGCRLTRWVECDVTLRPFFAIARVTFMSVWIAAFICFSFLGKKPAAKIPELY